VGYEPLANTFSPSRSVHLYLLMVCRINKSGW